MAKTETQPLISAARNLHLGDCTFDRDILAPDCPVPWFVRMARLHGGKQEGVDLITLDNGLMQVRVCPTRGMGIIDAQMGEVKLGWDSPVKEIVHPAHVNQLHRGRTGWLEGFNEFLVRCGLEFMGPPCMDTHHTAVGEPPANNTSLHGKIANLPASEVELEVQTKAPYAITLRGVVHERQMYGPKLELTAELTIVPGQSTFTVSDTVRNLGGQSQEMCLLYHINQGRPILEDGARLVAPIAESAPRDDGYPDRDIKRFDRYGKPAPASPEQVFFVDMQPDKRGRVSVLLHNKKKDLALGVAWQKQQLPHFALWKALHDERDGYVTGLEPCTTYPMPRPSERDEGRVVQLKPGGSYKTELEFELFDTKQAVAKAAARV
ncbi:MAG: aldose 1-epimerase family protein [Phycisphaeraceae bacterium]